MVMVDDEIKSQIKDIKDDIIDIKTDVSKQITEVKISVVEQGKKIDDFLKIMTEHAVLAERYTSLDKQFNQNCQINIKEHDEIFKRLRTVEMEINPQSKDSRSQMFSMIWDILKMIIGVLIAIFIYGKVHP